MILVSSPLCISHHWLKDIRSWGWGRSEVASPPAKRWEMDLCWKPSAKFWRFFEISTSKGLSPWSKNYPHPLQDVILWHIPMILRKYPQPHHPLCSKGSCGGHTLVTHSAQWRIWDGCWGRWQVCMQHVCWGCAYNSVDVCVCVSRSYGWQS